MLRLIIPALLLLSFMAWAGTALGQNAQGSANTGNVGFTTKPLAQSADGKAIISFAVTAPTDVEVSIVDANGKIVRHLNAGVLGPNAPAPFKKNALAQEIAWDLKDDDGKPTAGRPFAAKVSLGLQAHMDRVIGWSPYSLAGINGLAAGPDGTVYLIHSAGLYAHRTTWLISAFDKDARYLREVYPGPANLPADKRKGWPRITLDDGGEIPVVCHLLPRTTYTGAVLGDRMFPLVTADGRLVLLSASGGGSVKFVDSRGGRRLLILGTDGSVPENFLGPEICPQVGGFGHIALSPDGKQVYATGFVDAGSKGKGPVNVVYRVPLDGSKASEALIGKPYEQLAEPAGLSDPQGIDVDKDGNLYVADYDHDRIAVFKPDGSYLDQIKVECPDTVHVSRKTGAVYVAQLKKHAKAFTDEHWAVPAHNWWLRRIAKFGGLADKAEKAAWDNNLKTSMGGGAYLTMDESGPETVLWAGGLVYGGNTTLKLVDKSDKLQPLGEPFKDAAKTEKGKGLAFIGDVSVLGDKILAQIPTFGNHDNSCLAYSAENGEYLGRYTPKNAGGKDENMWNLIYGGVTGGKDNRMYFHAGGNVRRYGSDEKWTPFESTEKGFLENIFHGHTRDAGFFINRFGTIWAPCAKGDRLLDDMNVKVIGADGKILKESAVHVQGARIGGIAVDRAGDVYLGAHALPKNELIPAAFAGKLPADGPEHHPSHEYMQYGMIYKFPPEGGGILKDDAGAFTAIAQYNPTSVSIKDALWSKRIGYIGSHGDELGCHCETTRFDLDGYDRLFAPDLFRFRVCVFDSAGNPIINFGGYGNMDSRGPGSPVPEPEIPFGWPLAVNCGNDKVYIADLVNRRVVAVRLVHAVEETCAIK